MATKEIGFDFEALLPAGAKYWQVRRGTIQEVLNLLARLNIRASQVIYWYDDSTNALVVFCKRR